MQLSTLITLTGARSIIWPMNQGLVTRITSASNILLYARAFSKLCDCDRSRSCDSSCRQYVLRRCISRQYSSSKLTHYEILGVAKDATAEDVRAAFLQKSKECHPDVNSENADTHQQFVAVNEAYSVLSRPLARRDYDIFISQPSPVRSHGTVSTDHTHEQNYYHYPKEFYNQGTKTSGEWTERQRRSFYGIPGLEKVSNSKIVAACIVWILLGIIAHFLAVRKSTSVHKRLLDERDAKAHELWLNAKKSSEKFASESRLHKQRLKDVKNDNQV